MAQITLRGNLINTISDLPSLGSVAPNFSLTGTDLNDVNLSDFTGYKLILNIFPSIDTPVCAASVREFNKRMAEVPNTKVLCISKDLPFAHKRFCGAEGIEHVVSLSEFKNNDFSTSYGVLITDGLLQGLMARAVIILDESGKILYTQLVPEIAQEPDYERALGVL